MDFCRILEGVKLPQTFPLFSSVSRFLACATLSLHGKGEVLVDDLKNLKCLWTYINSISKTHPAMKSGLLPSFLFQLCPWQNKKIWCTSYFLIYMKINTSIKNKINACLLTKFITWNTSDMHTNFWKPWTKVVSAVGRVIKSIQWDSSLNVAEKDTLFLLSIA